MKKTFFITAVIAAIFCLTACEQEKQEDQNELAKMTVGVNQIRYGDKIFDVSCDIHSNVNDFNESFYYASAWNDDETMNCHMDLGGISLGKDIDISKKTNGTDYGIGFNYWLDTETPICEFQVDCHPDTDYNCYPETGAVKLGLLRADLKGQTMTVTLNAVSSEGVIVQAKISGEVHPY